MKRFLLIIVSTCIMINLNAQRFNETNYPKLFQKLVLDIGAIPFSASIGDNPNMSSYNFSLGYQVTKKLDVRINADVLYQFEYEPNSVPNIYLYDRILGLSLGANLIAFKGKSDTFLEKASFGIVGKFGAGVSPERLEQQSLFYDISFRTYLGNIPYLGLGINHQMYDSSFKTNFSSIYLSFGLDF
jgi:hypothetical protein